MCLRFRAGLDGQVAEGSVVIGSSEQAQVKRVAQGLRQDYPCAARAGTSEQGWYIRELLFGTG